MRAAFTADFSCERERANAPCLPIRPMSVRFCAPVARELAAQVRLRPAAATPLAPVFDKDDKATEVSEIAFPKPLAENAAFSVELPATLRDNAGRALANAASFPLKVADRQRAADRQVRGGAVRHRRAERRRDAAGDAAPRAGRPARRRGAARARRAGAARCASSACRATPTSSPGTRALQKYHETQLTAQGARPARARLVHDRGRDRRQGPRRQARASSAASARARSRCSPSEAGATRLDLPQLAGGDPRPFEVVGIPLAEPGYHVVEIESLRLGQSLLDKRAPMFVRTGVLVTNLGVHFKLGRENSVVWVTTLDRGKPVEGADVVVNDCNGKPLWSGRTDAKGLAVVARALDAEPRALRRRRRLLRQRAQGRRQGRRDRRRLRLQQLAEGHRVVALQRADRPRRRARPARRDGLRPHAAFAPARRCR